MSTIDYTKLQNVDIDGINLDDYPDFADAFISYAEDEYGNELTEEELDNIPEDITYEMIIERL